MDDEARVAPIDKEATGWSRATDGIQGGNKRDTIGQALRGSALMRLQNRHLLIC